MKVIIAGSRNLNDISLINKATRIFLKHASITEVVSGTARGVDRLGQHWASIHNIPVKEFPANWNLYGKKAGYMRNRDMGEYADALIAIWNGQSSGTKHMIDIMCELEKLTMIYSVKS